MSTVEGWKKVRICEFGTIVTGSTPDTKNDSYWGGDVPFVSPADFKSSVFVEETARTLSNAGVKQARLIPQNSILVTCIGSIGGIAIASCSCVTNQQINSIVCAERFDDRFIFYVVQHNISKLIELAGTTTLPIINKNTFGDIEIVLSTFKPEQAKIAEILSTVDRAIEQTEALIAKQQRIKTGLMQDLLTRGIDEFGNLRSEQTHEFKDSPLGRIPVEWEVKSLSYFVKRLDAGISVNSDDKPCGSGQIGVLKTSALNKGDFLPEQNKTVLQIEENRVRVSPTANTILISRMNTPDLVGESCFVDKDYPHLFLPDRIWMTIFQDGKKKAARWLSFVMTSPHARSYITLNATGTSGSMKNLPKASLFKMLLRAPTDLEEQLQIARLLECQNIQIGQMKQSLEKLRHLKTALMQDLLTGEKRVTALLIRVNDNDNRKGVD